MTVTQSPAVSALTASVTVLEKFVVDVQFTVVWPELALCTSMLGAGVERSHAALAPAGALAGGVVAAPAAELRAVAATSAVVPVPTMRAQRGAAAIETGC